MGTMPDPTSGSPLRGRPPRDHHVAAAASSYAVRTMLLEPEYKAVFPAVALKDDSQAKDEWRTTAGGMMYAVGAGGTITGYGAGKRPRSATLVITKNDGGRIGS